MVDSTKDSINHARFLINLAHEYKDDIQRFRWLILSSVVITRSVSHLIQSQYKNKIEDFNNWWEKTKEGLDPDIFRKVTKLRNSVLKDNESKLLLCKKCTLQDGRSIIVEYDLTTLEYGSTAYHGQSNFHKVSLQLDRDYEAFTDDVVMNRRQPVKGGGSDNSVGDNQFFVDAMHHASELLSKCLLDGITDVETIGYRLNNNLEILSCDELVLFFNHYLDCLHKVYQYAESATFM